MPRMPGKRRKSLFKRIERKRKREFNPLPSSSPTS
jgi:hypothetical protein